HFRRPRVYYNNGDVLPSARRRTKLQPPAFGFHRMSNSSSPGAPGAALVTGGPKRVGLAITQALAQAGYAVAVHANTSRAEAEAVCAGIRGKGGHAQPVQ